MSPTACGRAALSGVAFTQDVALVSRVTQGCQPIGPVRRVTAAERNRVLDARRRAGAALPAARPGRHAGRSRARCCPSCAATLVGLSEETEALLGARRDVRRRHARAPPGRRRPGARGGGAWPTRCSAGMRLAFCQPRRAGRAARPGAHLQRDPRRAEPDDLPRRRRPERARPSAAARGRGASPARSTSAAAGRGGPHFGAPSAELQIVRHALGDVPLVGFFAGGEIARHHLYGYTGVLTVFTAA